MGYTRFYILKKAAYELLFINLIGLVLGLIAMTLSALLLKVVIFDPNGYPFSLMKLSDALSAFVIPLCTLVASLVPAWWTLSRIDQIQIIDMFE
jgi:ABC-type enterochelin transport system permease subunit